MKHLPSFFRIVASLLLFCSAMIPPPVNAGGVQMLVSASADGVEGNSGSWYMTISDDGRFVAFRSYATNLVPGDTNGEPDVFVKDVKTGAIDRISLTAAGQEGDDDSLNPAISGDGRFVAFESIATNMVSGDENGYADVFLYDRQDQSLQLVSRTSAGVPANSSSYSPRTTTDGRYTAFYSWATNLVADDTNGEYDVFVFDRDSGAVSLVSKNSQGAHGNGRNYKPDISGDGRYVVFESKSTNLVAETVTGASYMIIRHDRSTGENVLVSVNDDGDPAASGCYDPKISDDGRFVVFRSTADNLVPGDTEGKTDVFMRDIHEQRTIRLSQTADGAGGDLNSSYPSISPDGGTVCFPSAAGNLTPDSVYSLSNVFVYTAADGTLTNVHKSVAGETANNDAFLRCDVSRGGFYVTFDSEANNLVAGDTGTDNDVFLAQGPVVSDEWTMANTGQIGGWRNDLTAAGNYAFVNEGYGLTVFDISGSVPQHVGQVTVADEAVRLWAAGDYLYAISAGDPGWFGIVDISDPAHPAVAGSCAAATGWSGSLAVAGNTAYHTVDNNGTPDIQVINLADPTNPAVVKTLGIKAQALTVSGGRLVVVGEDEYDKKFWVYDLTDPNNPVKIGEYAGGVLPGAKSLKATGDLVFSSVGYSGVQIFDISTPTSPVLKTTYSQSGMEARDAQAGGTNLYVAGGQYGLAVVDISSTLSPAETGKITDGFYNRVSAAGVGPVAQPNADKALVKVGFPAGAPAVTGDAPSPAVLDAPLASGSRLFGGSWDALWVYNILDPSHPTLIASYPAWANARPFHRDGNTLYILAGNDLVLLDITDPYNVSEIGKYTAGGSLRAAATAGGVAYLLLDDYGAGVEMVNVSTPASPTGMSASLAYSGQGYDITVFGGTVAVAGRTGDGNTVQIYDVSSPAAPVAGASLDTFSDKQQLWYDADSSTLFASSYSGTYPDYTGAIDAFDLTDPASPQGGGRLLLPKAANDVEVVTPSGMDPIILAAVPHGSVQTYAYSPSSGAYTTGPECHSPYSYQVTATHNTSGGYTVITSDSSYGTYIQEIIPNTGCCVSTQVSPAEAATDGCTASPVQSATVACGSTVAVAATAVSPWNFYEWTGAASGNSPQADATAEARCSVATANFVSPVLTLAAAANNPSTMNTISAVETPTSYRLTDASFTRMAAAGIPQAVRDKLQAIKFQEPATHLYTSDGAFQTALAGQLTAQELADHKERIFFHAQSDWKKDGVIAAIVLSVNDVDDWTVTSVGFDALGTGDERSDQDVIKVKLYKNAVGGQLLGEGTYSVDNGSIAFSMNVKITKGSSVTMVLAYDFDAEKACPCDSFGAKTDVSKIAATPDNYANYEKLPPPPQGVTGGPSQIEPGSLAIVSTNPQYGMPYDPQTNTYTQLPEPLKVKVTGMDHLCAENIPFDMRARAVEQGAKFADMSTSRSVPLNGFNEAEAVMMLGETKGMNNPYTVDTRLDTAGDQCEYPVYSYVYTFNNFGMGVELPATAKHDGTADGGDDGFGTFLNLIQMENDFIVTVDMAPPDFATVDRVHFDLGGVLSTDGAALGNNQYKATFDLNSFTQPTTLTVTCFMSKNGQEVTETAEYTVYNIEMPGWVEAVDQIVHEESFSKEWVPDDEQYKFTFTFPTNFAWSDTIPGDIGLLGGLGNNVNFEFNAEALFHINRSSQFTAALSGNPTLLGQEFSINGSLTGNFDPDFIFQRGTGRLNASTSFDLPEKGYSKTFIVYGVPITVAVDLSGNVEIYVNGVAILNRNVEFERVTVTPGTTITGNITLSLSAVLGLAKISATGSPTATFEIEITYVTTAGTATTWHGEVSVPITVTGSLFWGLASSELYSTTLGPWTFGSAGAALERSVLEGLPTPPAPAFLAASAVAADSTDRRMVVYTANTAAEGAAPNPDVFFRYFDTADWSAAAPVIGGSSPNGEWESDPSVVFLSGGAALAAWTANDGDPSLDNLHDILAAQDIAYALWDGSAWGAVGRITDDSPASPVADGTVRLAYNTAADAVFAAWLRDTGDHSADDADAYNRTGWSIYYDVYGSGSWTAPAPVPGTDAGAADFMPDIAADGSGNVVLVWARDGDGVFYQELAQVTGGTNVDATNADADIYWTKWTGTAWSTPQALTGANTATEWFPRVAFGTAGKAVAVWVEKGGSGDRIVCRIFDAAAGTWGDAASVVESAYVIDDPAVAVAGDGTVTVMWRGYQAGGNPLFLATADIDVLAWSDPRQVTHDDDVNLNMSMTLDGNGAPITAWTRYNPADLTETTGSAGFDKTLAVAHPEPGSAALTGTVSASAVDDGSDGLYDRLVVSAEVSVLFGGDYQLSADLFAGGARVATMNTPVVALSTGMNTLEISFPGGLLRSSGVNGPYAVGNLVLRDMGNAGVQTAFLAGPYNTDAYDHMLFAPGPLGLDASRYKGQTVTGTVTVTDAVRNADAQVAETVTVKVTSPMDTDGIALSLAETGVDTGVFAATLGFSTGSSNASLGIIKVRDHGLIQVFYDTAEPHYRWIAEALWETDLAPGDLDGSGGIDLADAIIVLKLLSSEEAQISTEYIQSEVRLTGADRVGMPDAVFILQHAAGLRP